MISQTSYVDGRADLLPSVTHDKLNPHGEERVALERRRDPNLQPRPRLHPCPARRRSAPPRSSAAASSGAGVVRGCVAGQAGDAAVLQESVVGVVRLRGSESSADAAAYPERNTRERRNQKIYGPAEGHAPSRQLSRRAWGANSPPGRWRSARRSPIRRRAPACSAKQTTGGQARPAPNRRAASGLAARGSPSSLGEVSKVIGTSERRPLPTRSWTGFFFHPVKFPRFKWRVEKIVFHSADGSNSNVCTGKWTGHNLDVTHFGVCGRARLGIPWSHFSLESGRFNFKASRKWQRREGANLL